MDISKLKEGMVIKSYKEMCELLGEKQLSRSPKQNQLHEWRKYFKWHNSGYQFVIDEVYLEPKEDVEMCENEDAYEVNTDKLEVEMIVKNYKEMCKILNDEIKGGKSKQYQFKNWERYFNWHKEGHKFIIDEIHNTPFEKTDRRIFGNNAVYSDNIQDLILLLLAKEPSEKINWSCNKFLKELSMVNNYYVIYRKEIPNLSKTLDIKKDFIYDFYNTTQNSLRRKLETALKTLEKRNLIYWSMPMMVYKEYIEIKTNEFGTPKIIDGKIVYNKKEVYEKANDEEIKLIMRLEDEVLDELLHSNEEGKKEKISEKKKVYTDKQIIFLQGRWEHFQKEVNKRLLQKTQQIQYYYRAYEIIYNYDKILEALNLEGESKMRTNLNNQIQEHLRTGALNRYKNTRKKHEEFKEDGSHKTKSSTDKLRIRFDYASKNNQLIDELIDIHKQDNRKINKEQYS